MNKGYGWQLANSYIALGTGGIKGLALGKVFRNWVIYLNRTLILLWL